MHHIYHSKSCRILTSYLEMHYIHHSKSSRILTRYLESCLFYVIFFCICVNMKWLKVYEEHVHVHPGGMVTGTTLERMKPLVFDALTWML